MAKVEGPRTLIRPWLQYFDDYPWQTRRRYDTAQIRAQITAPTKLAGSAGCSGIPPIGSTAGASRLGPDDVGTLFRMATNRRNETVNRRTKITVRPSAVSLTSPRGFDSLRFA